MRLSHIHEDGISRRDFLQKSGGGLAGLLVSGGLSPEVASIIASPNPPQLIATIITGERGADMISSVETRDVADSLKDVGTAYNMLRRLLGRNAGIGGGRANGRFSLGSYINPEDVTKLLKSGKVVVDDREGDNIHIQVQTDLDAGLKAPLSSVIINISNAAQGERHPFFTAPWPDSFQSYDDPQDYNVEPLGLKPQNLIKAWWNNWEKFGTTYLDKDTFSLLRKNGIDPTRPNLRDFEGYNTPNERKNATGSSEPEEWEGVEPEEWEKPEEPEKSKKLKKPRDYDVASSMHQWVENKSRFKTELDRVLSHIHEDDKSQVDPLEVRIVVKNDVPEELPESDNPLDNIRDDFRQEFVIVSISVEIRHNTKGVLETHTGTFNEGTHWPFSRYDYTLNTERPSTPVLYVAHDAWYTMHYANDWGLAPEDLDDNWTMDQVGQHPEDDQWLNRPMRSEFTLTWDHFIDIAERQADDGSGVGRLSAFDMSGAGHMPPDSDDYPFDFYPQEDPRSRFYGV